MMTIKIAHLEEIYDALADAIDRAPPERRELMLVKLVLLLAQDTADPVHFRALADTALHDL
jgi:hypothetical protein